MSEARDWNAEVIAEFRANKGEVKAPYPDPPPMLLLHTTGAKSGKEHVVPMRAMPDGDALYVFASAHGSVRNPAWYHNLVAHPEITIEKGTETIPVRATELVGAERDAIFARHAARFPVFAEYERKLDRTIPVIRFDRRTADTEEGDVNAFNAPLIAEFRANGGKVGGRFDGADLAILHTTGARTGRERLTPLVYLTSNDRLYVFAAGPGLPHHPAWYHNLVAHPDVTIEVGADTVAATASVLNGDARLRIWPMFVAAIPELPGWQRDAKREFPIIELTRKAKQPWPA